MPPIWIFDLDDTLHNAVGGTFTHIDRSMTDYIMQALGLNRERADHLRQVYWQRYGSTLSGLVHHHGIDPYAFLLATHQLDETLSHLHYCPTLRVTLERLAGEKIVLSNGPNHYVHGVLDALRIRHLFSGVYGLEALGLCAKPSPHAFRVALRHFRVPSQHLVMVDDTLANLKTAKRLGLRTVWIHPTPRRPGYVDRHIRHLAELQHVFSLETAVGA